MIQYYNRSSKKYEVEKIAGDKYLTWTYSSPIGMTLLELFLKKKVFSKFYGWYCDTSFSKNKIKSFVNNFNIDMSLYKHSIENFQNFNDFFSRQLRNPEVISKENVVIAPGDGRLFAYENITVDKLIQVKGYTYSLYDLLNNHDIAQNYSGGTCVILRLCPTDYHRFHFIDDGHCTKTSYIPGHYYSVNPIALKKIPNVFCENKREWSVFHSDHFGKVVYVEVGATCVGSIIQDYIPDSPIKKGDEKGYFKFGGSTVILFFEANQITIDEDIIEQSKNGIETKVTMGEPIGLKNKKTSI